MSADRRLQLAGDACKPRHQTTEAKAVMLQRLLSKLNRRVTSYHVDRRICLSAAACSTVIAVIASDLRISFGFGCLALVNLFNGIYPPRTMARALRPAKEGHH